MTSMNFMNLNGHCFPLRDGQPAGSCPADDKHCIHCGVPYTGISSAPCKGPPPYAAYAAVSPAGNATYPGALPNVMLNGKHVTRFVSIPFDAEKAVTLTVDFEAWSNIKNGAQTALILASDLPLRGEVVVTDGKRPVRCYISRCSRIGHAPPTSLWLACVRVVAHAEKRKSQKRELRRLNKQARNENDKFKQLERLLRTMTQERDTWRREYRKARGEKE